MTEQPQIRIEACTDGACSGNPGPGGWGVLLRSMNGRTVVKERELCGGEIKTTNNRMELMAAISALEALDDNTKVTIITDSTYITKGMTEYISRWKENNWRNAQKKPVKNDDLWKRLDKAREGHDVTWSWVKGHDGHPENERADRLAQKGMNPFYNQSSGLDSDPDFQ